MNLIAVVSGKGGTGKSCVAAYTGVALSEAGKPTLLIEQGKTAKSLDLVIAAHNEAVFDINDVLEGRCIPHKAVVPAAFTDNLFLMTAGVGPYRPADSKVFADLLKSMQREYDYVIVDGVDFDVVPPSLFDMILLVTTPDTLSARASQSLARELYAAGAEKLRLVINNVPSQVIPIMGVTDFDGLINLVGVQLIAVIPQSPKLQYCSNNAEALDEESVTIQIFDNLAARLRGQPRELIIR